MKNNTVSPTAFYFKEDWSQAEVSNTDFSLFQLATNKCQNSVKKASCKDAYKYQAAAYF